MNTKTLNLLYYNVNNLYYNMRGKCEFTTCPCNKFLLNKENTRCISCHHGKCWHKNIKKTDRSQFLSNRKTVRKPKYFYVRVFTPEPLIPILIQPNNYCPSVDELPA